MTTHPYIPAGCDQQGRQPTGMHQHADDDTRAPMDRAGALLLITAILGSWAAVVALGLAVWSAVP